jgi:uncharacterized protein with ParB-like and HNH nuclease domain
MNTDRVLLFVWRDWMSSGIQEPRLSSVGDLLKGNVLFKVPIHQRNFDWGKDEVEELWEDICFAVDRQDEDYFLGTVVLRQIEEKGSHDSYEIVDGQQRLTCISMIFSAIHNEFESRNDVERAERIFLEFLGSKGYERHAQLRPKIELNETNNETYLKYIIRSENREIISKILKDKKKLHVSNQKLLAAYEYFLERVSDVASAKGTAHDEFLVPLITTLNQRVKLIVIPVTDDEGAYLVFESVNARGKELAVSDLVKNRLYYEVGNAQVQRAKDLWDKMEVNLRRRPIPEYLRHFWIAKRAESGKLKVREKDLYRRILRSLPDQNRKGAAIDLLADLSESAQDYAKISDFTLWPDDSVYDSIFEYTLEELQLFRVSQCYPVLLNVIQRFPASEDIVQVFQAIANFSFRYNIIGSGTSGSLEAIFGKTAFEIREGSYTSAKDIADELRAANSDRLFRTDFQLATFSKWKSKLARYTLVKIENYLRRQKRGDKLGRIDPNDRRISLEHILPQNEESHKDWRSDFEVNLDPADYVYRIGNLTLLTKKLNRESADRSFLEKKSVVVEASDLLINEYIRNVEKWGNQEIEQRQDQLSKYAVEIWKL